MRNISFFLTQQQIRDRTKTVTRRQGWAGAKPGERLQGVVKAQGLKPGEKIEKLAVIEVVSNRPEPLNKMERQPEYGKSECVKEGFPEMDGEEFVEMFCEHMKHQPDWPVNRIEFKYVD